MIGKRPIKAVPFFKKKQKAFKGEMLLQEIKT